MNYECFASERNSPNCVLTIEESTSGQRINEKLMHNYVQCKVELQTN